MHKLKTGLPVLLVLSLLTTSVYAQVQNLLAGENEAKVNAIDNVVAEGAQWSLIWADFYTADGIMGMPDGGVLFAQEQTDKIIKLNSDGKQYTYFEDMNAPGSVAADNAGRMFAVQRTCTEPMNSEFAGCNELTRVAQIAPEYRLLASSFADGSTLGRVNDLIADGMGGAYFTSGGLYHVSTDGEVSVVADQDIFTNGLMLSRNGRTLYVTNRNKIEAFDVARDGSTSQRRDFVVFEGETFTDGIALDTEGRLYVTGGQGIHVVSEKGEWLGTIPTPRAAITITFADPDKKTLYVPMMGAIGPDGKAWTTPEGIRNTAMTIYTLPMLTSGFSGRPK